MLEEGDHNQPAGDGQHRPGVHSRKSLVDPEVWDTVDDGDLGESSLVAP